MAVSKPNSLNEYGLAAIRAGTVSFGVATLLQTSMAPFVGVTYVLSAVLARLSDRIQLLKDNVMLRVMWDGIGSTLAAYGVVRLANPSFRMPALFWIYEMAALFYDADQEIGRRGLGTCWGDELRDLEDRLAPPKAQREENRYM